MEQTSLFIVNNSGGTHTAGYTYSGAGITINTWHHYAFVFDGSKADNPTRLKCYVDGVEQSCAYTGTWGTSLGNMDGQVRIGYLHSDYNAVGKYDQLMIAVSALTAPQVAGRFAAEKSMFHGYESCEGNILIDTAFNGVQADTIRAYHNASADTLTKTTLFSSPWNVKSLFSSFGAASYCTTGSRIDSVFTVNRKDTLNFVAANNVGRSGAVQHIVQVAYSDTTPSWGTVPASAGEAGYKGGWLNKYLGGLLQPFKN